MINPELPEAFSTVMGLGADSDDVVQ